jgi:hypothetical protein
MRISLWVACILASGAALSPLSYGDTASQLKSACGADMKKLCSDVTPGEGRIVSCMNSKEDKLSPSCATAWGNTKARISRKIDQADVAFRRDCGSDVQKFCSNVPSGKGRILSCLDEHQDGLSNSCKGMHAKIDKKLDDMLG